MLCKFCKRDIEEDSIFCRYCGEKVQRNKKKAKEELNVPKPERTAAGLYRGRPMVNGTRVTIIESSEAAYYARARALKAGLIAEAAKGPKRVLGDLIDK